MRTLVPETWSKLMSTLSDITYEWLLPKIDPAYECGPGSVMSIHLRKDNRGWFNMTLLLFDFDKVTIRFDIPRYEGIDVATVYAADPEYFDKLIKYLSFCLV